MHLSPLATFGFPQTTPGPHKHIGYAYVKSSPLSHYFRASPVLRTDSQSALKIEEVAYSVYYPSTVTSRGWFGGSAHWVPWLPEPVGEIVAGYERFIGTRGVGWILQVLRLFVGGIKFPAYVNASLEATTSKYPMIIFSHGLVGTRNAYSRYCSALASEGYVVLAIEHRDGSGPAVMLPSKGESKSRTAFLYTQHKSLSWADGEDSSLSHFRTLQLDMRITEVYEVFHSFRHIVLGTVNNEITVDDLTEPKREEWMSSFRNQVDTDNLSLTGHSFGGGTMIDFLHSPPPATFGRLPVKKIIALDPWIDPLPIPSMSKEGTLEMPEMLVINSPGFTVWTEHFTRLQRLVDKAEGHLMTILGIGHQSFSDFPLLAPTSPSGALGYLSTIHALSTAFLKGELQSAPSLKGKEPDHGKFAQVEEGKMAGENGSVVLHLLASRC